MQTATPVVPVIEYATSDGGALASRAKAVAGPMMFAAVGSGFCVGVCFLGFAEEAHLAWVVLHPAIFLTTLGAGVIAGMRLRDGVGVRMICDLVAGVGLLGLALVPPTYFLASGEIFDDDVRIWLLGACYLLMAATTLRHLLLYRQLAAWARQGHWFGLARSFLGLGWTKTIFEGVWLGCCAATLMLATLDGSGAGEEAIVFLALSSFFGCFVYAAIWIWMMIAHAMLMHRTTG